MTEGERLERCWIGAVLREDEFQLVTLAQQQIGIRLRADADPIEPGRRQHGAVGLDGNLEALVVYGADERIVHLQQRLTARAHEESTCVRCGGWPRAGDRSGEIARRLELPATRSVGADEVRIAELTSRLRPILLVTRPEVAAGAATEHGRSAGLGAFPLERVENLFDRITHAIPS